jgi:tRNA(His) 5'-end guanylyltransferase
MKQSMDKLSLGGRMKEYYEGVYKIKLPLRMPVIIRLDGKAFHTLTSSFQKPFDETLIYWMNETAKYLCENIQGAQVAYVQSDEISILVHGYKKFNTQPWFSNEIQKMVSISAGIASALFSQLSHRIAVFDSRVFVIPPEEVCNYFIWRQKDWERNSIQMLAQSLYSHKELHKKDTKEMQEMCFQKGRNWNDLSIPLKRGRCAVNVESIIDFPGIGTVPRRSWQIDNEIPIFTQDRDYIDKFLDVEEE